MVTGRFTIRRWATDQLQIELQGELDAGVLAACETEVRALLSAAKAGSIMVLVDLQRVDSYCLKARDELVVLQRFLGAAANQTAFVANTAAARALALWVTHTVDGQVIKSFGESEAAKTWLAHHVGPTTGVRPLARPRNLTPTLKTKVAG